MEIPQIKMIEENWDTYFDKVSKIMNNGNLSNKNNYAKEYLEEHLMKIEDKTSVIHDTTVVTQNRINGYYSPDLLNSLNTNKIVALNGVIGQNNLVYTNPKRSYAQMAVPSIDLHLGIIKHLINKIVMEIQSINPLTQILDKMKNVVRNDVSSEEIIGYISMAIYQNMINDIILASITSISLTGTSIRSNTIVCDLFVNDVL